MNASKTPSADKVPEADKILGCFLLGGCSDALGAPIEIHRLKQIRAAFGAAGLETMIPHLNAYDTGIDYPKGSITDDTAMTMTTLAALRLTLTQAPVADARFAEILQNNLWQAFLNWGQHQDDRPEISAKIDRSIPWPDDVKAFWFNRGAGRGTIAALSQDAPGSLDAPHDYKMMIRGKETVSPNAGCGGMMRVSPFAFLPVGDEKLFALAGMNGAITNGHPDAVVATGITALLVRHAAQNMTLADSLRRIDDILSAQQDPRLTAGIPACRAAIAAAMNATPASGENDFDVIDRLPRELGYKNPFLAVPVLAQVLYAVKTCTDDAAKVKQSILTAINHGGDSDSVGAIAGNILGAKFGTTVVPQEWLSVLIQKQDITAMAQSLTRSLSPAPATAAKPMKPKGP